MADVLLCVSFLNGQAKPDAGGRYRNSLLGVNNNNKFKSRNTFLNSDQQPVARQMAGEENTVCLSVCLYVSLCV